MVYDWNSQLCHKWIWIEQCFMSPPTQYRLHGRRFLQVKRPNQQYQSTKGTNSTQTNQTYDKQTWTQNTASPLVYNNMGWLGDATTEGRVARPEGLWGCCHGTPSYATRPLQVQPSDNIPHLHLPISWTASSRRQLHMWQRLEGRSRLAGLHSSASVSSSSSLCFLSCTVHHPLINNNHLL